MRPFLILCIALWAAAWAWSFIGFAMTEPTGDGFTRGLNRTRTLFLWQFVATSLSIPIWLLGVPRASKRRHRWLARIPALLGLLPMLVILTVVTTAFLVP